MAVLTEEAWKMLLSGGSSVGNASVVAVILLVGTSHCAMEISIASQVDSAGNSEANCPGPVKADVGEVRW